MTDDSVCYLLVQINTGGTPLPGEGRAERRCSPQTRNKLLPRLSSSYLFLLLLCHYSCHLYKRCSANRRAGRQGEREREMIFTHAQCTLSIWITLPDNNVRAFDALSRSVTIRAQSRGERGSHPWRWHSSACTLHHHSLSLSLPVSHHNQ